MGRLTKYIRRVNQKLDMDPELPKGFGRALFLMDCAMARAFRHISIDYYAYFYKRLRKPLCWRGVLNKKKSWAMWELDTPDVMARLNDKAGSLRRYANYVHRDWLSMKEASFDEFEAFAKKQGRYIAKPRNKGRGVGVHTREYSADPAALRVDYEELREGDCVVEGLIQQHPDMARLHPGSVNTIRIASIRTEKGITLLSPCMRVGNGGVIDNFSGGGMLVQIHIDTGRVETDAVDKKHHIYDRHPLTGVVFKGYQVPNWETLKASVREAAMLDPDAIFVGWDMAITQEGVEMVELNDHQFFGWQDALGTNWRAAYRKADKEARRYFALRQRERAQK